MLSSVCMMTFAAEKLENIKPKLWAECCSTITSSSTASGTSCNGEAFSITASETRSNCNASGDCYAAFRNAQTAARNAAYASANLAVVIIESGCDQPQP